MNKVAKMGDAEVDKRLNPLKSGHCYWMTMKDIKALPKVVLIPLNRVIVIEFKKQDLIWAIINVRLNPLKSGHCYWIAHKCNLEGKQISVLIPLNRVIVIE